MKELQKFSKDFQKELNWAINDNSYDLSRASLLNNYMLLTTEVAEVAEELRTNFNLTNKYINQGVNPEAAFVLATKDMKDNLADELADCLAYLLKFSNFFDIDMEEAFYKKMKEVKVRENKDISYNKKPK